MWNPFKKKHENRIVDIKRLVTQEDGLIFIRLDIGRLPPHKAYQVIKHEQENIKSLNIKDTVLIVPVNEYSSKTDINHISEKEMNKLGWFRKEEMPDKTIKPPMFDVVSER